MHVDRRTFLKGTAAVGGALGLGVFDLSDARAEMRELKISRTTETRSIITVGLHGLRRRPTAQRSARRVSAQDR